MSDNNDITGEITAIRKFLHRKKSRVHMLGICGVGMAGLAFLLKKKGFRVTGCDQAPNNLAEWLSRRGISVFSGHDPAHVAGADLLIRSGAVQNDIPELKAARKAGKKIFRRGMVLAAISSAADSICVSGTHGKSTTTAMIIQLLNKAGLNPSFCIGGEVPALGGVAGQGTGSTIVVEADESDGTLSFYKPSIAVITNIEFDHAEYFRNMKDLKKCFAELVRRTKRKVIYCFDDREARKILRGRHDALSYGFLHGADFRLINFRENSDGLSFSLTIKVGMPLPARNASRCAKRDRDAGGRGIRSSDGSGLLRRSKTSGCEGWESRPYHLKFLNMNLTLPVPGKHNALNAAAACAVGLELGIPFADIARALSKFQPVSRRFERIVENKDLLVISDYAHHPTEIAALLSGTKALKSEAPRPDSVSERGICGGAKRNSAEALAELGQVNPSSPVGLRRGRLAILTRHSSFGATAVYPRGKPRRTLAKARKRWLAVFQPHRYSRTKALGKLFPPAFAGVDELILCPVYEASEKIIPGGTSWDLYEQFRLDGKIRTICARSLRQAWDYLKTRAAPGDGILIIGAGDVAKIGEWAKKELTSANKTFLKFKLRRRGGDAAALPLSESTANGRARASLAELGQAGPASSLKLNNSLVRYNEPLAQKTTLRVGGAADIYIEAGSLADLALIVAWAHKNSVPVRVLGAGSNVLASDLGVRGIVLRLRGINWQNIRREKDGIIVAGAGVSLQKLVSWTAQLGLTGAGFLTGIPGTIGGALRMNAGAWGREFSDIVRWVRVMEQDGTVKIINRAQLGFSYRCCAGLKNRIVLEAALNLRSGKAAAIRKQINQIIERRRWMSSMRSAGSIFKNPNNDFAGRLIDSLGLKGRRIGGVKISEQHANIITTEKGATASDVFALIEIVRYLVKMKYGVDLTNEVEFFE